VFAPALGGNNNLVSVLLLVFGLAGAAGNLMAGRLADRHGPRRVVIGATVALTVVFLAMAPSRGSLLTAIPLIALAGVASWSVTTPQQHRVIALAPDGAGPLVVSLNAAVMYLAISLSSVIGAIGLNSFGSPASLLPIAAVFTAAAALLTWLSGKSERRVANTVAGDAKVAPTTT